MAALAVLAPERGGLRQCAARQRATKRR
jgi:hypothetical protein